MASRQLCNKKVDIVHYAKAVTPQLQDPHNPECCPLCFAYFMQFLFIPADDRTLGLLILEGHEFFDACARMLTAPRCAADLSRLQGLLKRNAARCRKTRRHEQLPPRRDQELKMVISGLFQCLTKVVVGGPRPVKVDFAFARRARRGRWPTTLDQLLPFGAQDSVTSYVFWVHTLITPVSFLFMWKMLHIARPTLMPHLLADPLRHCFLHDIIFLLRLACLRPGGELDARLRYRDIYQGLAGAWSLSDQAGAVVGCHAIRLLRTIESGTDAVMDDIFHFYGDCGHEVLDALLAVADCNVLSDERNARDGLAALAWSLHVCLELEGPVHPCIAQYLQKVEVVPSQQHYTPGHFVFVVLCQRFKLRTCAGPGCTRVAAATSPEDVGKLQACARCGFIRYCSRGCQQADWREPDDPAERAPHKALCPILCKLWRAGARIQGMHTKKFAAIFDRAGIERAEFQTFLHWAATSGVVPESVQESMFESLANGILQSQPEARLWLQGNAITDSVADEAAA